VRQKHSLWEAEAAVLQTSGWNALTCANGNSRGHFRHALDMIMPHGYVLTQRCDWVAIPDWIATTSYLSYCSRLPRRRS
jgi:hypothetical protein